MSLVSTIRDEARDIQRFVDAIDEQTHAPDQIVVVEGGSGDGTLEILRRAIGEDPRWLILERPGVNISTGRNIAIAAAAHPTIAVIDGGAVPEPTWLERLLKPLETAEVDVCAGFFAPGGETWFERCLGTIITPTVDEIEASTFLPSSRSIAFRREAFDATGGYPEWLSHCEDLVFDLDLKQAGAAFAFVPKAIVRWNARPSLGAFAKQYFRYARGDGHAGLFRRRHLARYATYAFVAGALRSRRPSLLMLLPLGYLLYAARYHRRVSAGTPDILRSAWTAHGMVPVVLVVGDTAKMAGYPAGLLRRRRRRST